MLELQYELLPAASRLNDARQLHRTSTREAAMPSRQTGMLRHRVLVTSIIGTAACASVRMEWIACEIMDYLAAQTIESAHKLITRPPRSLQKEIFLPRLAGKGPKRRMALPMRHTVAPYNA